MREYLNRQLVISLEIRRYEVYPLFTYASWTYAKVGFSWTRFRLFKGAGISQCQQRSSVTLEMPMQVRKGSSATAQCTRNGHFQVLWVHVVGSPYEARTHLYDNLQMGIDHVSSVVSNEDAV